MFKILNPSNFQEIPINKINPFSTMNGYDSTDDYGAYEEEYDKYDMFKPKGFSGYMDPKNLNAVAPYKANECDDDYDDYDDYDGGCFDDDWGNEYDYEESNQRYLEELYEPKQKQVFVNTSHKTNDELRHAKEVQRALDAKLPVDSNCIVPSLQTLCRSLLNHDEDILFNELVTPAVGTMRRLVRNKIVEKSTVSFKKVTMPPKNKGMTLSAFLECIL